MERIIGIDLGTTNSEVAVIRDGQPFVVPGENGSGIMPSYVSVAEDGRLLTGEEARNQYAAYPERTVRSIKRQMGKDVRIAMAGEKYTPQEISAIILKKLKKRAEIYLESPVDKAVVTVPAYFSDAQRQATKEAGEIAGLEIVRMINEPTAAALAYEAGSSGSKKILIYDLGGGTFDVSVVMIENGVVEVIASHGNNHLGGDDFDRLLTDHILDFLKEKHGDFDLDPAAHARLVRGAERAKINLSDNPFAIIEEEFLFEQKGVPVHLSTEISREEYESLISGLVDDTMETVHFTLKSGGLVTTDIEEVVLVGGSTRTPMIKSRLEEIFQLQPRGEVDPDLCVVCGAAIQAGTLSGDDVSAVLVDVTPYTFGTSALGQFSDGTATPNLFVPVIKKNTPIPVKKSEVFFTCYDGQESVVVNVFQGEKENSLENIKLGEFYVEGLADVRQGNEIVTTFELDNNGMLRVTAVEKRTGLKKDITINRVLDGLSSEEVDKARGRIIDLFGEEDVSASDGIISETDKEKARAVMERAKSLIDDVTPEDGEDLIELVEKIDDALKLDDQVALNSYVNELTEIIFYLEV
ncbi:Hsp70 family protein [Desulfomarina sp.]